MTTFYLIRHASNDVLGKAITGRKPGVSLNPQGLCEAENLAARLAGKPIQMIFSSPLERVVETAVPLAKRLGLDIQISEALNEIDFGNWTHQTFEHLAELPGWQRWNSFRSGTRAPNGETMLEAQTRIVTEIQRLRAKFPEQTLAFFSHGDLLRAALAYFLGIPLDLFQRMEVSPASVSILQLNEHEPKVVCVNAQGSL
ncbi:MAG TPA: histidine phosphatase family protein [Verrucomicrobiae bacterium]|jgi:probable phosphoglycerate mutase|nr:histidine phosphatase family protein [Verrucomicrobiae bacterium]